jgi:hypothetical protein
LRRNNEIERALIAFAAEGGGGRALAIAGDLSIGFYAKAGGLISYGFDPVNQFQQGRDMSTAYCVAPSLPIYYARH